MLGKRKEGISLTIFVGFIAFLPVLDLLILREIEGSIIRRLELNNFVWINLSIIGLWYFLAGCIVARLSPLKERNNHLIMSTQVALLYIGVKYPIYGQSLISLVGAFLTVGSYVVPLAFLNLALWIFNRESVQRTGTGTGTGTPTTFRPPQIRMN